MSRAENHRSTSAEATETVGQNLAQHLRIGDLILLEGELAAGKTTFARGILRGLEGDPDAVSSPTFVLLQSYDCNARGITCLHHVDLYRLGDRVSDLREIGLEEVLSDTHAAVMVEWPKDILASWLPADGRIWKVSISTENSDARVIKIHPPDTQGA